MCVYECMYVCVCVNEFSSKNTKKSENEVLESGDFLSCVSHINEIDELYMAWLLYE